MTAITLSDITFRKGFCGDIKMMVLQLPDTTDDSQTIDLGSDSVGGYISTILNTLFQDDLGEDFDCSWNPATGIITLGTGLTEGVHNLVVFGI